MSYSVITTLLALVTYSSSLSKMCHTEVLTLRAFKTNVL